MFQFLNTGRRDLIKNVKKSKICIKKLLKFCAFNNMLCTEFLPEIKKCYFAGLVTEWASGGQQ